MIARRSTDKSAYCPGFQQRLAEKNYRPAQLVTAHWGEIFTLQPDARLGAFTSKFIALQGRHIQHVAQCLRRSVHATHKSTFWGFAHLFLLAHFFPFAFGPIYYARARLMQAIYHSSEKRAIQDHREPPGLDGSQDNNPRFWVSCNSLYISSSRRNPFSSSAKGDHNRGI